MLPVALNLRACINILRHIILWLTDLQVQLAADTSIWRPPPFFSSRQLSLKGVACRQVTFIVAKWRAADWRHKDRVLTPSNVHSLLNVYRLMCLQTLTVDTAEECLWPRRGTWRTSVRARMRPWLLTSAGYTGLACSQSGPRNKAMSRLRHYSYCAGHRMCEGSLECSNG